MSPRETAMRMLEHMAGDVSYEDIIRQLRILQQIDWAVNDVEMAGMPAGVSRSNERQTRAENVLPEPVPKSTKKSSLVLRSRPLFNWKSLAERSEDHAEPFAGDGSWID